MLKQKLVSAYKNNLEAQVKEEVHEISECGKSESRFQDKDLGRWPTSWFEQFIVLLERGVKERKSESFSGLRIGQVLVVAIISGLLWYKSHILHLQDQVRVLY